MVAGFLAVAVAVAAGAVGTMESDALRRTSVCRLRWCWSWAW